MVVVAGGLPSGLPSRVGDALAEGSFSIIYKTVGDRELSVVKVIDKNTWRAFVMQYGSSLTFTSEIAILSELNHPNIIRLISHAETELSAYLELPYMPGGSLYDYIAQRGPCDDAKACVLGSEILSAISHVHACGILHRDIKLENVLCTGETPTMSLQLSDFGLSKHVGTGCNTLCGTPIYRAPELHGVHGIIPLPGYKFEVDAWSFGVLYYTLHYEEFPFDADSRGNPDFTTLWKSNFDSFTPPIHEAAQRILTGLLISVPAERLRLPDVPKHNWLHCHVPRP
jgi:serine/threonine protein kinase